MLLDDWIGSYKKFETLEKMDFLVFKPIYCLSKEHPLNISTSTNKYFELNFFLVNDLFTTKSI